MGFQLRQLDMYSFETQLNQLASKIVMNAHQLDAWTDKIIELRALQMDGFFDDDQINQHIDTMESYIDDSRLILQDIAEKVVYAKEVFHHCTSLQQQDFLEYHSEVVDTLLSSNRFKHGTLIL